MLHQVLDTAADSRRPLPISLRQATVHFAVQVATAAVPHAPLHAAHRVPYPCPCSMQEDMRVFNIFLFQFTLPASVILGLGIKTNLYSEPFRRSLLVRLFSIRLEDLLCLGCQRGMV